jgi:hypothetical protein
MQYILTYAVTAVSQHRHRSCSFKLRATTPRHYKQVHIPAALAPRKVFLVPSGYKAVWTPKPSKSFGYGFLLQSENKPQIPNL